MKYSYMKEWIQCRLGNDTRISINLSKMVGYPCEVMIELSERLSLLSVVNGVEETLDSIGLTFFHVMEQAATDERSYDALCTLNECFGLVTFEVKYSICIWQVLTLLYEYKEAHDVYASCPTLFWLVLTELNKQQQPIQVIAATMRKKRKLLLDVCGLPPRKLVLNVLRNLECERFSDSTRRLLHQFDWEKNSFRLAHLKKIYPVSMCLIVSVHTKTSFYSSQPPGKVLLKHSLRRHQCPLTVIFTELNKIGCRSFGTTKIVV